MREKHMQRLPLIELYQNVNFKKVEEFEGTKYAFNRTILECKFLII